MKKFVTLLAALLFAAPLAASNQPQKLEIAQQRINDILVQKNISGAAVTVMAGGEVLMADGFGTIDHKGGADVTDETAFAIGSITKSYTALAIMMLVDRGEITLDTPVNPLLGTEKLRSPFGSADQVTIRHLLNHTSGLPYHHNFFFEDDDMQRLGHDESIRRFGMLVAPPGEGFMYTNFGYGLLEYVIERVSGKSYRDFLRDEILTDGSLATTFLPPVDALPGNTAHKYTPAGREVPLYDFDHRGGAALYASAHDLARFGMLMNGEFNGSRRWLKSIDPAEMLVYGPEGRMGIFGYASSWHIQELGGNTILTNSGAMPGVAANILISPETNAVISVVVNSSGTGSQLITDALTQLFFPHLQSGAKMKAFAEHTAGTWHGEIDLGDAGRLPLSLDVHETGKINAQLDGKNLHILDVSSSHGGDFVLSFYDGVLPTPDALRYPHRLELYLKLRGDRLTGFAAAEPRPQPDRLGNGGMTYWVQLQSEAPRNDQPMTMPANH